MPNSYSWDPNKNRSNIREHGADFESAERFEWETAVIEVDDREDYGELREFALGFIGVVLHALVFIRGEDSGDEVRLISLRKATNKEKRYYANSAR